MNPLNRQWLKMKTDLPIKIVQFGEGNFLRAFVDYAVQKLNEEAGFNAGIAVVQPIEKGLVDILKKQEGLYTLFMKGVVNEKEIQEKKLISSIVNSLNPYTDFEAYLSLAKEASLEFVVSNTTEAGIAYVASDKPTMEPPSSFPAKLTLFLYERYRHFEGDPNKGLTIIPCELINYNADTLLKIILQYCDDWQLENTFKNWLLQHNSFHNTLVDRIVPGYPKDDIETYQTELDYQDNLIVTAEKFFLWVIEGGESLKKKLPFHKTDLNVLIVPNMQPYRTRKVRILNGAHTTMVPFGILYGNETVKQTVDNGFTGKFVRDTVFNEIIPTLELEKNELTKFANEVFDRFRNPFIKHQLSSIALNSVSKFKVRVLPSLLTYHNQFGNLPPNLTYAFACLILFYKGNWNGKTLPVQDDAVVITQFKKYWELDTISETVTAVLSDKELWNQDLTEIKNLTPSLVRALEIIENEGLENGFHSFTEKTH
ncbi:tagaturonate reductase [Galbibacter mesophilus]|uniref:tagaturonate reductase n=1 Tax=Galbibacter mesophilus TaxID=379069 RepID=UPI00191FCF64|nr:tagaturonate reductase [Galbibacter mesophilus]MCM5663397.1 tagaturonate reductase [Galbibacter mesophilus]